MSIKFCSFSSGSSGNSYLIKTEKTALLIDAGISCKRIVEGLKATSTELDQVKGVLVTHEHIDHVAGVRVLSKKLEHLKIIANEKTFDGMEHQVLPSKRMYFSSGDDFQIEDLEIKTFSVSHDAADPVGFSIRHMGQQVSVITDSGKYNDDMLDAVIHSDLVVLEANHDVDMLMNGPYHPNLKRRVLGDNGHLSNKLSGELLAKAFKAKAKEKIILLGHLSGENNKPEIAFNTVKNILEHNGCYHERDYFMSVMDRKTKSPIFEL